MKKLELEDFFTESINLNASKLPLKRGGEETNEFLMIKGFDSKSVSRLRFERGIAYRKVEKTIADIKGEDEKAFELSLLVEDISKELACELIESWSFSKKPTPKNKMALIEQNAGLASIIVAHSATEENYYLKK